MCGFVLGNRLFGQLVLHRDAVPLDDLLAQIERFLKLVSRFEIKDRCLGRDLGKHVNDRHAFGAEGRRHGEFGRKAIDRPFQDFLRRCRFQLLAFGFQFGQERLARLQRRIGGQGTTRLVVR